MMLLLLLCLCLKSGMKVLLPSYSFLSSFLISADSSGKSLKSGRQAADNNAVKLCAKQQQFCMMPLDGCYCMM